MVCKSSVANRDTPVVVTAVSEPLLEEMYHVFYVHSHVAAVTSAGAIRCFRSAATEATAHSYAQEHSLV